MGGCYRESAIVSSRSYQSKRWETALNLALRGGVNPTKLAEAMRIFLQDKKSGFIGEVAKARKIAVITAIPNEFPEVEYEVKFDIQPVEGRGDEPTIAEYLDAFEFPPVSQARYLKDSVHSIMPGINRFFGTDSEERLVVISKDKGLYLKEKSEYIPHNGRDPLSKIVLKRKEVRWESSVDEVATRISETCMEKGVQYRGQIRKEKGDDFILDMTDGRIYSFTITRAHLKPPKANSESAIQRQLEIEYAGFIPGFPEHESGNESQLIQGMVDLGRHVFGMYHDAALPRGWRFQLYPTMQRKYDFVAGIPAKKQFKLDDHPSLLS